MFDKSHAGTTASPNLYLTEDFRSFKAITEIYPERQYNWLSAELVNWETLDSIQAEGILFKPENFDPQKKVPRYHYIL